MFWCHQCILQYLGLFQLNLLFLIFLNCLLLIHLAIHQFFKCLLAVELQDVLESEFLLSLCNLHRLVQEVVHFL